MARKPNEQRAPGFGSKIVFDMENLKDLGRENVRVIQDTINARSTEEVTRSIADEIVNGMVRKADTSPWARQAQSAWDDGIERRLTELSAMLNGRFRRRSEESYMRMPSNSFDAYFNSMTRPQPPRAFDGADGQDNARMFVGLVRGHLVAQMPLPYSDIELVRNAGRSGMKYGINVKVKGRDFSGVTFVIDADHARASRLSKMLDEVAGVVARAVKDRMAEHLVEHTWDDDGHCSACGVHRLASKYPTCAVAHPDGAIWLFDAEEDEQDPENEPGDDSTQEDEFTETTFVPNPPRVDVKVTTEGGDAHGTESDAVWRAACEVCVGRSNKRWMVLSPSRKKFLSESINGGNKLAWVDCRYGVNVRAYGNFSTEADANKALMAAESPGEAV